MQRFKLLVVDDNAQYCAALEAFFGNIQLFEVLPSAYGGFTAIDRIYAESPDVVILDMVMPHLDGIGVLQQLRQRRLPAGVHIFANSPFADDALVKLSQELGVAYFLLKPMQAQYVFARVMDVLGAEKTRKVDLAPYKELLKTPRRDVNRELLIGNCLKQVGIPAHVSGYLFLKAAVEFCADRYGKVLGVTTEVYPYIAERFNSTTKRVERNIRHAIEYAWDHGNIEAQHKLFGYTVNDTKGRPTNKEFIALVTDRVVMQVKYR